MIIITPARFLGYAFQLPRFLEIPGTRSEHCRSGSPAYLYPFSYCHSRSHKSYSRKLVKIPRETLFGNPSDAKGEKRSVHSLARNYKTSLNARDITLFRTRHWVGPIPRTIPIYSLIIRLIVKIEKPVPVLLKSRESLSTLQKCSDRSPNRL